MEVCLDNIMRLEKLKGFKHFQLLGEDWQFNKFQGIYFWEFKNKAFDGNGMPCDLQITVQPDEDMIISLLSVRGEWEEIEGIGINLLDKKILITEIMHKTKAGYSDDELIQKMKEYVR